MSTLQFDYDSIRERLISYLSAKTEHQNIMNNSAIMNILEAIAEEMEDQMEQDEYLTIENNWELAQNKSSLLTESKVHNYDVPRKRGATGSITFGVSEDFDTYPSAIVDLPKWTEISNSDGTVFTTVEATTIPTTSYSVDASVVQGESKTYTTYAAGDTDETITISNDSIENDYYNLYVNDIEWEKVDTLFDYGSDDKVFELKSLPDFSGIKITFGDGINGQKLESGDEVVFYYVETLGEDGNIVASDNITNVDSTIYDINGDTITVYCTNDSSISGGEDEAGIEEIREDSPRFFQSGGRATTADDYETIINSYSYIKKASVIGAYEYNLDNGNDLWEYIDTQDNLVRVIALSTTDVGLTEAEKIELTTDIRDYNAPTDILTYPDITIIPMKFNMDVAVSSVSYTLSEVKASIDTSLEENYSLDTLEFYESVYASDYDSLIDGVEGVRKHSTYVSLLDDGVFSSAYAKSITLPLFL